MPRAIQILQTGVIAIAIAASVLALGPSAYAEPRAPIAKAQQSAEPRATAETETMPERGAVCAWPSETWGIPPALDAAISGPADKDRACMRALLTPDARITLVSIGEDGAASYKVLNLDDWIARTKARGHIIIEEKQQNFRVDRFGNIAHVWSMYTLRSDGHAVARGINSIEAVKETGRWRVTSIMAQAESAAAPLPEDYLP